MREQTKGFHVFYFYFCRHEKENEKNVIVCSSTSFDFFDIKNLPTRKLINKKVKRREITKNLLHFHKNTHIFFILFSILKRSRKKIIKIEELKSSYNKDDAIPTSTNLPTRKMINKRLKYVKCQRIS